MSNPAPRGTCPVCLGEKALKHDGTLGRHAGGRRNAWPPQICDGWNDLPIETIEHPRVTEILGDYIAVEAAPAYGDGYLGPRVTAGTATTPTAS